MDCHRLCLRNDKSERIYHEGSEELEVTSCLCEEVTELATRQSIVSRRKLADSLFGWCRPVDRGGLSALAMTRMVFYHEDSKEILGYRFHCEEGTE